MQLIILLTIVNQLTFAPKFDPNLKWQKLTTAHFNVYFSNHGILKNNEEIAKMVTWYCEDAHRKLTSFMGYAPYGKTNVIIGDFYDYPTGWATTFPQNTIFINLALPKELKVYYRNWLEHLILHEYTHILTMDMVFGLNKYSRKIFGRIITPNVLLPLFLTEGYAIYNETKFTKKGRLNSSYYQMIMRAKILDNKIFPLDKWVTYELAEFPGGETPYFYGGSFLYYLAEEYGEEKIIKFVQNHSKGFPLFFNCYAKRIWQKNFFKLWHDFKIQTIKKYQSQINELQSKPLTPYQKLTTIGYYVNSPIYAPDGQKIYFTSQSSHEQTTLWELDLITKKKKSLLKANISSPIRISPDGKKIVFCIRDYYNNFYYYDDLYLFELQSKKLKRLTQKMRTADPCFFSSNDKIVFVKNEFGEYSINVLELSTGIITTILESNDCEQYLSPCPSPDGKKLALIIRTPEGNIDLFIYDLVTEWLIPITHNTALELTPCWSQNNYLFFVSDLNKVFNIYAYNIKNEAFYQITNVLTGAFAPSIAPNNQELLFLVYSSKGYDICYTKINYDSLYSISPIPEKTLDAYKTEKNSSEPDTIYGVLSNYSSITSLFPKFWLPLFTYNQSDKWSYGALTYGSDILFKHQYLFYALYKKPLNKSLIHFEYLLNCFYPEVSMRFSYQNNNYLLGINSCFPYIKNEYRFSFTVSYFYEKKNLQTGTIKFAYDFSNAKTYAYSISPEHGRAFSLCIKSRNKLWKSAITQTQLIGSYKKFINLPLRHHVFVGKFIFAYLWGQALYPYGNSEVINIRGSTDTFNMHYGINLSLEYRFPIIWIERGVGLSPIFFKNISGNLFCDLGKESNSLKDLLRTDKTVRSIGGELTIRTLWFYEIPLNFTIGTAWLINRKKMPEYYFKCEYDFATIFNRSKAPSDN